MNFAHTLRFSLDPDHAEYAARKRLEAIESFSVAGLPSLAGTALIVAGWACSRGRWRAAGIGFAVAATCIPLVPVVIGVILSIPREP